MDDELSPHYQPRRTISKAPTASSGPAVTSLPTPRHLRDITAWGRTQNRRQVRLDGRLLRLADEAVTVRIRDDRLRWQQGPSNRPREKMCTHELIEAANLEAAVTLAASHPMARAATIEVRPVWEGLG